MTPLNSGSGLLLCRRISHLFQKTRNKRCYAVYHDLGGPPNLQSWISNNPRKKKKTKNKGLTSVS